MITVVLSASEWAAAESLGLKREALRVARGKSGPQYKDNGGSHERRNKVGAVAEYALAKFLGPDTLRLWCEYQSYSEEHWKITSDVGKNLHVRATDNPKANWLVLHPYDPDTGAFVFAKVDPATLTVRFLGWDYAKNWKNPEQWNDKSPGFDQPGRGAYTIDHAWLRPCRDASSFHPGDIR